MAGLVPTGVNAGSDPNRDYFAQMIPQLSGEPTASTTPGPTSNYARWKTDWVLADMQERTSVMMVDNTKELLNLEESETWYYRVCPVRPKQNTLRYTIHKTFFRPRIVDEAPPRTVPYNLDIQQTEGSHGLTRYHTGFEVDSETLLQGVNQGTEWFQKRVAMMVDGIVESDKFFIITSIMNSDRAQRIKDEQMLRLVSSRGLENHIQWELDMFGSAAKERAPIEMWVNSANADWRVLGVAPSMAVTIVHEHTFRLIVQENEYYTTMSQGGNARMLYDGPDAMNSIRGQSVFTTRDFLGKEGEIINPVGAVVEHHLYYTAVDVHRDTPTKPYVSSSRNIKITDPHNKTMAVLGFLDMLAHTERWNMSTGELHALSDESVSRANEDTRRSIGGDPANDAFHVVHPGIEEGRFTVAPAKYWGSLKLSTLSSHYLRGCAETVCANMPSANELDQALDSFMMLVSQAGNTPLFVKDESQLLQMITANVNAVDRPAAMIGCKPVNPLLEFLPRNAATRFANLPAVAEKFTAIPPGFGRLSAMRALSAADHLDGALKTQINKILEASEKLASILQRGFANSILLDPNYAPTDMFYATPADMLFDQAMLPRRAVLYVSKDAAPLARDKGREEDALYFIAGIYRNTQEYLNGKYADLDTYRAVATDSATVSYNKAMVLQALRSLAKTGRGDKETLAWNEKLNLEDKLDTDPKGFKDLLTSKLAQLPATAFNKPKGQINADLKTVRDAAVESLKTTVPLGTISPDNFIMTPFYLEPSQVAELAEKQQNGTPVQKTIAKRFTVGRSGMQDFPATRAELKAYGDAIRDGVGELPVFATPSQMKFAVRGPDDLGTTAAIQQIRKYLAEQNITVGRAGPARGFAEGSTGMTVSQAGKSRRARMTARLEGGGGAVPPTSGLASAFAADPSGRVSQFFSCQDAHIADMFTADFAARWLESNTIANGCALLIMRLYMTTPTNWHKSIVPWHSNNVRIPVDVFAGRRLEVRVNPVIRIIPGADTMEMAREFPMTNKGTDQHTGMFHVIHSYYSAVIVKKEENIQVLNAVDLHGYVAGMGASYADLNTRSHEKEDNGGRDVVPMLVPAGTPAPFVMSPFGGIASLMQNGSSLGTVGASWSSGIAMFESRRQNTVRPGARSLRHPDNRFGHPVDRTVGRYWSRDTTLVAGPSGDYVWHMPSAGLLPKGWTTSDLRSVLDGKRVNVKTPFEIGSNYELSAV